MTAIVGLAQDGRVYLGGDSAGVAGYSLTVRTDAKVFTNGLYAMGFTTSFRMGQLLRYAFQPPRPKGDLSRFMVTTFVDALRTCLKDGGWAKKNADQEEAGTFLVGVHGQLFTIHDDYQVAEPADLYAAVGCGHELATGALFATAGTDMKPRRRIRVALEAAEHASAGVRGPFSYVRK
ncbi:hypothetical protein AB0M87_04625 [Streptomyces sp. NPDC051320]|uniref:hypothetical protein n=1 Tax=Streptomyces sp. NPDC051320 TaxID=3154644 RepID=UPI003413D0D4